MKIKLNKTILLNACLLLLLSGFVLFSILVSFNSKNLANELEIKLLPVLFLAFFMWILFPKKKCKLQNKITKYIYLFGLLGLISSIVRFDYIIFASYTVLLLIIFFFSRTLYVVEDDSFYTVLCLSMILPCCLTILVFDIDSYNSQGVIYAFAGVMMLNLLCYKKITKIVPFTLIVIVTVSILELTRSRTSMAGFLLVAIISYAYLFLKEFKLKNILILIILIIGLLFSISSLENYFVQIFFNKWGNADLTSNRTRIWKTIINNTSFFGHGINHLNGGDAHNVIFQILGCSGLLCMFSFIVLWFSVIKSVFKADNKIIFVNFFTAWFFVSCFENLDLITSRMLPISILFIMHLFLLIKDRKNCYRGKKNGQKI